ncbi:hypothetical protein PHYPSEUDO_001483 [Phytophthora pseudosyringae]|uniref:Uncharacterized protein n=1 Tax=Phytophthora pseudosyringae TaxID=221518 RepID=A0A8T1VVX4_9STRA|nr:hypothetical protein PHYPSEUDO_001483 [Phytophthora pseudosyringae]
MVGIVMWGAAEPSETKVRWPPGKFKLLNSYLLTSVEVVCREIPHLAAQTSVTRRISLGLLQRMFARIRVKSGRYGFLIEALVPASKMGLLNQVVWLGAKGEEELDVPVSDLVKEANALSTAAELPSRCHGMAR